MTVQQFLRQVRVLDTKIKQKEAQYLELYQAARHINAIQYDRDAIQCTNEGNPVESLIVRYVDLEKELKHQTFVFYKLKAQIIDAIQSLDDDRYVNVLFKRYVEYKSYDCIAEEMHYSVYYVKDLHKQALNSLSRQHLTFSYPQP